MSWHYRIVQYPEGGVGLHEVHFDAEGKPTRMTAEAVRFTADSPEELHGILRRATRDARRRAVFHPPATWTEENRE